MLGWALVLRKRLSVTDGSMPLGIVNGLLFSGEFCLLFLALDYTTVSRVSLFFYTMPVWVALGAHVLVPGERLTLAHVAGLALAVAGAATALGVDVTDPNAWKGDLLAIGASMFWASIALVSRTTRLSAVTPEMNLLYQLAVSAIVMLIVAPLVGETVRDVTPAIVGIFAFQVIVIVAIGFVVWFWILSIYPVGSMASFSLLAPVFGVFFGWLIFDDTLTPRFVASLAMVVAGIVLINRPRSA